MADIKFSALADGGEPQGTDDVVAVRGGGNIRVRPAVPLGPFADLAALTAAKPASAALAGRTALVGAAVPYTLYRCDGQSWNVNGSLRVVYTSSVCVSDSNLGMTSFATGTNQTAKLQALLDLAAFGPLLVIWDGAYSVKNVSTTQCLRVRSNTTIKALQGCGAINIAESPTPMFRNYNPTITPGSIVDVNIAFEGGIWHGNRANQSVKETAANGGVFMFDFVGVTGLTMSGGIEFRKAKAFAWRAANAYRITLDDYTVDFGAGNTDLNTDGIHFNGPCSDIVMTRGKLWNCADDAIAFNADDGWGAGGQYGPYGGVNGAITDVTVDGVNLKGSITGIRLLSGGSRMDNFKFSDIKGKTGAYWLVIDNFDPTKTITTGPGNIGSVEIEGVRMENVATSVGTWTQAGAHINCKVEQLTLRDFTKGKFLNVIFPAILFGAKADINQLLIDRYKSYPFNGGTYLTDQITFTAGAKVKAMAITNSQFDAPQGGGAGYPITIPSGVAIEQLTLMGNRGFNFTDFLQNLGSITSLHAPAASNFMDTGGTYVPSWVMDALYTDVSATALTYSGPGTAAAVRSARRPTVDAFNGDVKLSSRIRFTGTIITAANSALIVRGSTIQPWANTTKSSYFLDINAKTGQVGLKRNSNTTDTALGSVVTAAGGITVGADYDVSITAKGTALSGRIQRVSDGLYLQTDGSWAATAVDCVSATDANIATGTGKQYGVYSYCWNTDATTPTGVQYTNFIATAAP